MRPFGGDPALGRHPRVAKPMAPLDVPEPELQHERLRAADLLVDLDRPACAHDPHVRPMTPEPVLHVVRLAVHDEDGVIRPYSGFVCGAEHRGQLGAEAVPGHVGVEGVERQLARAARRRVAVDGYARAVGPAIAHLLEHRGQVLPEPRLELRGLAEESNDSTHMVTSYTCPRTLGPLAQAICPLFLTAVWSFPPYDSEARQVLLDLP